LADAGVDDFGGIATDFLGTEQFAAGYDIEAGVVIDEGFEHRQVAVGLDGKADQVRYLDKSGREGLQMPTQGGVGINVKRRTDLSGDILDSDIFAEQIVAAVLKVIHMNNAPQIIGLNSRMLKSRLNKAGTVT
jgi:hypothetical protein